MGKNIFIIILFCINVFCYSLENFSDMVLMEGGIFKMGNDSKIGSKNEKPAHEVIIDDFYIGRYEVTQKEWNKIMDYNPSEIIGNELPVNNVSWLEAVDYCNTKSSKDGLIQCYKIINRNTAHIECDFTANGYRLPTEAEWEYAARGGNKSKNFKYSGSNNIVDVACNFNKYIEVGTSEGDTFVVINKFITGMKSPNELDIFDMSGNVAEWCWDWYDDKYYDKKENNNPKGPSSGVLKVLRGGYKYKNGNYCMVSARNKESFNKKSITTIITNKWSIDTIINYFGFRLAKRKL